MVTSVQKGKVRRRVRRRVRRHFQKSQPDRQRNIFLVAVTRLYTLLCRSVGRSVTNFVEFRAVIALRPLPNRPRLSCPVSGLVFVASVRPVCASVHLTLRPSVCPSIKLLLRRLWEFWSRCPCPKVLVTYCLRSPARNMGSRVFGLAHILP